MSSQALLPSPRRGHLTTFSAVTCYSRVDISIALGPGVGAGSWSEDWAVRERDITNSQVCLREAGGKQALHGLCNSSL